MYYTVPYRICVNSTSQKRQALVVGYISKDIIIDMIEPGLSLFNLGIISLIRPDSVFRSVFCVVKILVGADNYPQRRGRQVNVVTAI